MSKMERIPEEIVEVFAQEWDTDIRGRNGYLHAKTERFHIEMIQAHLSTDIYKRLFESTDVKFGETKEKRVEFWRTVFSGNYNKFFEKFPRTQKVEVNNEIFMI